MSERLAAAIEELEEHLTQQLNEAVETKKMINALCKRMGQDARYEDVAVETSGAIRSDQYYGKPLASAASDYLERRKRALPAEEILKALEDGGFDFDAQGWKEKDRLRLLASSLAKNTAKFHRLPNGSYGLLAWYDQAMLKRAEKEDRKQNGTVEGPDADDKGDQAASA